MLPFVHTPEKKECILSSITSIEFPKLANHHASNSLIVYGESDLDGPIAIKLSPFDKDDNSLEVERSIYMFMEEHMKAFTPHFAFGLEMGTCDIDSLFSSEDRRWNRYSFFAHQWRKMCQTVLLENKTISEKELQSLDDDFKKEYPGPRDERMYMRFIYDKLSKKCNEVHFVFIPKMPGKPLDDFLEKQYRDQRMANMVNTLDLTIAIQVAQALCVAKNWQFMHNDLHLGNIFIHKAPGINTYEQPFLFQLTTQYQITIFDYNLSSIPTLHNKRLDHECQKIGICNQYKEWVDWNTFLNAYVYHVEQFRPTLLREILGGEHGDFQELYRNPNENKFYGKVKGERAFFGYACRCKEDGCKTCIPEEKNPVKLTPIQFLDYITSNPQFDFVRRIATFHF